ncbi:MAG: hypothetical protein K6G85_07575 [Eubacterium sp.]|nr:hypothetical protein [Eubacterium sp.]
MKKIINKIASVAVVAALAVSMSLGNLESISAAQGMYDIVLSYDQMTEDAKSRVTGKNKQVEIKTSTLIPTYNYNQTTFNNYYNVESAKNRIKDKNGKLSTVDGTCTEIALTCYVEYMIRAKKMHFTKILTNDLPSTDQYRMHLYVFLPLVNYAIKQKYMIKDSDGIYRGTEAGESYQILSSFLNDRGIKCQLSGSRGGSVWTTLTSNIKAGNPVPGEFCAPNEERHTMLANAVYTVTVNYKKGGKNKSETFKYIRVNNGWWSSTNSFQFVRRGYLESCVDCKILQ